MDPQNIIATFFASLAEKSLEFPGIEVKKIADTNYQFSYKDHKTVMWLNSGVVHFDLTVGVACLEGDRTTREIFLPLETEPSLLLNEVYTRLAF